MASESVRKSNYLDNEMFRKADAEFVEVIDADIPSVLDAI